ncbi:protein transport Sec1a-like [Hibiscus syriacus]|uniref:protein transport Sec1a-like n=1 Tax=Hibiscus syriacus TaxID=106335 RepID=UPI0019214ABA|nr:protein transport Sec1a-like [Hibiscus syriacus]
MSFSDSEHGGGKEYKVFRQFSRDRLLYEMLGASSSDGGKSTWKVLIMDKVTVKVMSHSCKMADITDQGVSLVEDIFRRRQPLPTLDAIYFMQPTRENIIMFLSDMSGREPLYKKAFIFFSSPVQKELINHIKADTSVLPRIGALREMNLEYFPVDSQAFITDHDSALVELFSEDAEKSKNFEILLNVMATRIATVFASLKELPYVRYRAPRERDGSPEATRSLIPSKLADSIWQCISNYKSIPNFPQTETCDLLILDRSVDQIAPVIHEWTYDAMCHDLLEMDGNKYVVELPGKHGGPPEKKEVLLEDHDPVWLELRHAHIADASERLHEKMTTFKSKNKAANIQRDGEMSTRDLQKIVQALPQYNETVEKLTLHVEIAGILNECIRDMGLRDLGQLEQDLVFGDAGSKEVINLLRTMQDASTDNKLRLLMIYAVVYPEKFEGDKATKLMQLAKLTTEDMQVVNNMKYLGGPPKSKKQSSGFSLKFDGGQKEAKNAARKDRTGEEEETWQLFRFFPFVEELIENLSKGQLPKDEYSCINEPPPPKADKSHRAAPTPNGRRPAHSMRSRRTPTWARGNCSDDGYSSDSVLKNVVPDFKRMGQRIFVFIIGGATRSELRACHKLTAKLRREVILGSTSFDDPPQYISKLKQLSEKDINKAKPQN